MRVSYPALVGLGLIIAAGSAQALESEARKASTQSVDVLWQKIGDFCGIGSWHPAIEKCELSADKKRRTLTLKGGGTIVEELVHWNNADHSYTYRLVSGPLPVADYRSILKVVANKAGGSVITWSAHYLAKGASDAEARKAIDGVYESGLAGLAGN
jgi:hypothetical protein